MKPGLLHAISGRVIYVCFSIFLLVPLLFASNHQNLVEPLIDSPGKTVGSDFNGDGIHDLLVGGLLNDDGPGNDAGAVYILYGSGSFSATYPTAGIGVNVTILGKADGDRLSTGLAGAGDINSDGFDDIVMGANQNDDGGGLGAGAGYVLYGHPALAATIDIAGAGPDITVLGKAASDQVGYRVSGAGDLNGDGFDDVAFGSRYADDGPGANNNGAIYVLYGGASLSLTYQIAGAGVSVTINGKATTDGLFQVSAAGDVNNDGLDDLIMGARFNNDGGTADAGAAYILFGSTSLASNIVAAAATNVTILGDADSNYLGDSGGGVGDINGDGFSDVSVGASGVSTNSGAVYVLYGRVFGSNVTFDTGASEQNIIIPARASSDYLGFINAVWTGGDINDDGFFDLVAGANRSDDGPGGIDDGAAYIIYGSTSLASSINAGNSNVTILGAATSDQLGRGIGGIGDFNNDGIPDITVAALNTDYAGNGNAGAAHVIFGSLSLPSTINIAATSDTVLTVVGKSLNEYLGASTGGGRGNFGP